MGKRFVGSFSTGKDSTFAIYKAIEMGYEPQCLIITYNVEKEKAWFHGVDKEIINLLSDSLNIPIKLVKTDGDDYEEAFENALKEAFDDGARYAVFGDIDIENHKKWNEERCKAAGLELLMPLWQRSREDVVRDFIEAGFKTVITAINTDKMDEKYLGRILDFSLMDQLRAENVDVCGENGEYHTLVVDGPIFSYPVELDFEKDMSESYVRLIAKTKCSNSR